MFTVALLAIGLAANNAGFMSFGAAVANESGLQSSAVTDNQACSIEVADKTGYAECTTTAGATVAYIGDSNETFGSSGTGTFEPFVRLQASPTEHGYNTNASVELDTSSGKWTHAILISEIPVIYGAHPYWELFADVNDGNGRTGSLISLNDVEIWFTSNANITGYGTTGFSSGATKVYDFAGAIKINDVNQGSGRGDVRYRIPIEGISIPANCTYGDPTCTSYFVLYSRWGTTGGDYISDGGFEEWKVKQYPTLQIVKNTVGGDGTFSFAISGTPTPTVTSATITTTGSTGHTPAFIVQPGAYAVTENNPPAGWTLTSASCATNGGSPTTYQPGGSLVIAGTDHVVCTFNNAAAAPSLTLRKSVVNDNGGTANAAAWTLAATGSSGGFSGTGSPATGSTASITHNVTAGVEYTLSESNGPSGYSSTGTWTCIGGGTFISPDKITLGIGASATCTITNDDIAPSLTLDKIVVNDNGGTAAESAWTLTANGGTAGTLSGPGAAGSTDVTSGATFKAGTYALSESAGPGGYSASSWSCAKNGGAAVTASSITLGPGDTATCTITNDDNAPGLHLRKNVNNDNGGTAVATDWTLTATGPTTISGTTPVDSGAGFALGTYALSESTGPSGYSASSWVCTGTGSQSGSNITLAAGQSATCTITNDDIAPRLHLRKTVVNDNGGTAAAADFTLTANGTGTNDLSGTSPVDSGASLKADTWALSETGPAGYAASSWSCVGGTQNGSSITVGIGGEATCTITNDDIAPSLTLDKVVVNDNGGTAVESDWTLTANGGAAGTLSGPGAAGSTDVVSGATFKAGTYTLSESTGPTGYSASAWVCTGTGSQSGSTITLALGQSATCTISNVQQAAQLTLVKQVTNDNGGTAAAADFTLSAAGPTPISGKGGVTSLVGPGTYTLSETGPSGYTSSGWTCVKSNEQTSTGGSITLANGDDATCTITNDDVAPSLTLVKNVVNDNGGTAAATAWTLTATGPTTISGAGGVTSGATFKAGTYILSESAGPAGYSPSSWVCTGTGSQTGSSITLAAGQSATCTITNNDNPPAPQPGTLVVLKYNDVNGNGTRDSGEPMLGNVTFTLSANGVQLGTLVTDANGSAVRSGLGAGSYTIAETIPTGWFSTDPGGNTPSKTATVNVGGTTTVLFGNKQVTIPPTTIGGTIIVTKYEDANRNKQRDTNEGVLSGWTFTVRNGQGALVATITTAANGTASLANLAPGTYTVTETVQSGWVSTDPGSTAPVKTVTIAAGQTINLAFGNAKIQLPSTSTAGGNDPGTTLRIAMLGLALLLFTLQRTLTRARRGLASGGRVQGKGGTR